MQPEAKIGLAAGFVGLVVGAGAIGMLWLGMTWNRPEPPTQQRGKMFASRGAAVELTVPVPPAPDRNPTSPAQLPSLSPSTGETEELPTAVPPRPEEEEEPNARPRLPLVPVEERPLVEVPSPPSEPAPVEPKGDRSEPTPGDQKPLKLKPEVKPKGEDPIAPPTARVPTPVEPKPVPPPPPPITAEAAPTQKVPKETTDGRPIRLHVAPGEQGVPEKKPNDREPKDPKDPITSTQKSIEVPREAEEETTPPPPSKGTSKKLPPIPLDAEKLKKDGLGKDDPERKDREKSGHAPGQESP